MTDAVSPSGSGAETAHWTAAVRAMETQREEPLFRGPWASLLVGKEGATWISGRSSDSVAPIVLRTRFFDDFLQRVVREHSIRQVILMAAGLDTRAFRLTWPEGTVVYELDRPGLLERKEELLRSAGASASCERRAIGADLAGAWEPALSGAGFDSVIPAVWLLEGILFNLPSAQVTNLLDRVSRLTAPGSWLGFDIINRTVLTSPLTRAWIEMRAEAGVPWIGYLDDPEAFLTPRGWRAELSSAGQPDAHHGRWPLPVIPVRMPGMPHNWFVVAEMVNARGEGHADVRNGGAR
jgi:methyltransferase (TIGR00027 family)